MRTKIQLAILAIILIAFSTITFAATFQCPNLSNDSSCSTYPKTCNGQSMSTTSTNVYSTACYRYSSNNWGGASGCTELHNACNLTNSGGATVYRCPYVTNNAPADSYTNTCRGQLTTSSQCIAYIRSNSTYCRGWGCYPETYYNCSVCSPSWTPAQSSYCANQSFTQTDGCGNSRVVNGTLPTLNGGWLWGAWGTCNNTTFTQTRTATCTNPAPQCGGAACSGSSTQSQCCDTRTDAQFCAAAGKTCGSYTANNACGISRTVADCGACGTGYNCSTSNTCEGDCGLRGYDGNKIIIFACENPAVSKLHISKNGVNYGVGLVLPTDVNASKFKITTSLGVRALKMLDFTCVPPFIKIGGVCSSCGNGTCEEALGETSSTCPADCVVYGKWICYIVPHGHSSTVFCPDGTFNGAPCAPIEDTCYDWDWEWWMHGGTVSEGVLCDCVPV